MTKMKIEVVEEPRFTKCFAALKLNSFLDENIMFKKMTKMKIEVVEEPRFTKCFAALKLNSLDHKRLCMETEENIKIANTILKEIRENMNFHLLLDCRYIGLGCEMIGFYHYMVM
ncbi:hypothetical protein ACH5RR_008371 [Cinchona calisaya]|uniref:Uncharacterized protein n=1 Tax=Cinchona calisaya TaxID=153742 RepID=A0ABD3ABE3_9GENT